MQKIAIDAGGKFDPYSFKTGVNEGTPPCSFVELPPVVKYLKP